MGKQLFLHCNYIQQIEAAKIGVQPKIHTLLRGFLVVNCNKFKQ